MDLFDKQQSLEADESELLIALEVAKQKYNNNKLFRKKFFFSYSPKCCVGEGISVV